MPAQHTKRINPVIASCVDEGIAIERRAGAANAWTYMMHKAVPAGVIRRVLAWPALRRCN